MAALSQQDRIERKLDAVALTLGGSCRREFDRIGWATRAAARTSAKRRKEYGEQAGAAPKVAGA